MSKVERVTTDERVTYLIDKSQKLGQGAFGTVYSCKRENNPRQFAAKLISCYKKRDMENLRKEIQVHQEACRQNPYVTKLVDYVIRDISDPYNPLGPEDFPPVQFILVTEKMEMDLRQFIDKRPGRKLKEKEAQFYFIQLVEGLKGFSRDQIIHRDLKLENIMVRNKRLKFVDFGLSTKKKLAKSNKGTPFNMPPWMLRRNTRTYDKTVDLYAIGLILFEMVVGFHPWDREYFKQGDEILLELADTIEAHVGANLFKDYRFYRSRGFDPEKDISPDLRRLLEHLIRVETTEKEDYNILDLYNQQWMRDAIDKYDHYYRIQKFSGGDHQRDLISSQLQSSIFKSKMGHRKIQNTVRLRRYGQLEEHHLELQESTLDIKRYLEICYEQLETCLNLVYRSKAEFFESRRTKYMVIDLLKKTSFILIGNLCMFGKLYQKEAFTSSGFIDYLVEIHGKQVYKLQEVRNFFKEILQPKEEYTQQKSLAEQFSRDYYREFQNKKKDTEDMDLNYDFNHEILKKIETHNWEDFEKEEDKHLKIIFKSLVKVNNRLYSELVHLNYLDEDIEELEYEDEEPDEGVILNRINRTIYAVVFKIEEFRLRKKEKDFLDLDLATKETNTTSVACLKLDVEGLCDNTRKINEKPLLPFLWVTFWVIVLIILFVAFVVK